MMEVVDVVEIDNSGWQQWRLPVIAKVVAIGDGGCEGNVVTTGGGQ